MTQSQSTPIAGRLQEALTDNPDFLRELLERALQRMLESEFAEFLGAEPHQRIESRTGYRCGYYDRSLVTGCPQRRTARRKRFRFLHTNHEAAFRPSSLPVTSVARKPCCWPFWNPGSVVCPRAR